MSENWNWGTAIAPNRNNYYFWLSSSIFSYLLIASNSATAQIAADGTIPTQVNQKEGVAEITGGKKTGNNLFHSFQSFSVPTGNTAFFKHDTNVSNIIGRVTGGGISNIDGVIRAQGNANLILINPAGINFGANASLELGGSFLASTADSVLFADGTIFSAQDAVNDPLLTMTVPVGLQLGTNSRGINVSGSRHDLTVADPLFSPVIQGKNSGLRVKPEQTLALVGGELIFDGGIVTAPGGSIELGSVSAGQVGLNQTATGWNFNYENVTTFDNIQLQSQSLANASGTPFIPGGSIQVQAEQLDLNNGSLLLIQNSAPDLAGGINVNTTESVTISGTNPSGIIRSSLTNETIGAGGGGDVNVNTDRLTVEGGATVVAKTLNPGTAPGGNVKVEAADLVQVIGANQVNPSVTSSIVAASFGSGDSGNNSIATNNLQAIAGGSIAATTFNTGRGGNLSISAENITVRGIEPNVFAPSALTATTLGTGNAGSLTIDTATLTILNGGRVDASTAATGDAGSVTVDASKSIEVRGTIPNSVNPSLIISAANILDPALQELLRVPAVPSGNSGNVTINTPQLQINDGAQVTVKNDGSGNAGKLKIDANSIALDTQGGISAVTQIGAGGDIDLQIRDSLQLQSSSQIASDNYGAGAGGNVNIDVDTLSIGGRSFISSTTFGTGKGGDINIDARDVTIVGTGFAEFQQTFQLDAFTGKLQPNIRGTGIFTGTATKGIAGNLTINTDSLSLSEGAIIFNPMFTAGKGGDINITATDIKLNASALQAGAGLTSIASASVGDINLETERLEIRDGGTITNITFGDAAGGDINITAFDSIELKDSPIESIILTGIYTNTSVGIGTGGDVEIETVKLKLEDAVIASNTGGLLPDGSIISVGGSGGNINIQADESIESGGIPANPIFTSGIGTTTYSASDAGNMTISTGKLIIRDGADFATATLGKGDGGQLTINATDSVELIGTTDIEGINRGGLFAASGRLEFPNLEPTGASGDIKITTPDLIVREGATINVQSLGIGDAGNLEIAADSILLASQGNLSADTRSGAGGNIQIKTNTLEINRGLIDASVFGTGTGGNIEIDAQDAIKITGSGFDSLLDIFSDLRFLAPESSFNVNPEGTIQGIIAITVGDGKAGQIEINTPNLQLDRGAFIGTATLGEGAAGSMQIAASDLLRVDNSIVTASTIFTGQGGNIEIDTGSLEVLAGGQVIASTLGSGDGGNLTIKATDSIVVEGTLADNLSSANNQTGTETLSLDTENDSNSATTTPRQLNITSNSAISVGSTGTGNAGTLNLTADTIALDRQGVISAATQSGVGGNIDLQTDALLARRQSQVSAKAEGNGDGGNINIRGLNDNNIIVLLEQSDIIANAFQGAGGNIQIETQALFTCPECTITASSQLGVDGQVTLDILQPNTILEAVDLPQQLSETESGVALACGARQTPNSSELTITGRGGLPPRPQEPLSSESLVSFAPTAEPTTQSSSTSERNSTLPPPARSWYLNPQGEVVLAASNAQAMPIDSQVTSSCDKSQASQRRR